MIKIITSRKIEELEKEVNKLYKKGWVLKFHIIAPYPHYIQHFMTLEKNHPILKENLK